MANVLAITLKKLLEQKGFGILSDPKLLKANLLDLCPQENTEINLLLIALQENIPQELKNHTNSVLGDVVILQMAKRLESNYCIEKSKAYLTVESWAYALNLTIAKKQDPAQQTAQLATSNFITSSSQKFTGSTEVLKLSKNCSIEFVRIEPGKFFMGSPLTQRGRMLEELEAKEVEVRHPFYLSIYPITISQFIAIEGYVPESSLSQNNAPVLGVLPAQAIKFCNALSRDFGFSESYWQKKANIVLDEDENFEREINNGFFIPTEYQWEYACRAGSKTMFPWADEYDSRIMSQYCLYGQKNGVTQMDFLVGLQKPNRWGLYDMLGLIWEFTDSKICVEQRNDIDIFQSRMAGRVVKGGSWRCPWGFCKPSSRGIIKVIFADGNCLWTENSDSYNYGFRIAKFCD
jgi:formylglycine-generating enzyme required for sulfatase activity